MEISIDKFLVSLPISLKGILGIFIVIAIVYVCTLVLCRFGNKKKSLKNN